MWFGQALYDIFDIVVKFLPQLLDLTFIGLGGQVNGQFRRLASAAVEIGHDIARDPIQSGFQLPRVA